MFLPLASLSTTEVGFFTAVATVIPVFAVAYVVGLGKAFGTLGPGAARVYRRFRPSRAELARRSFLSKLARSGVETTFSWVFGCVVGLVLLIAVFVPGWAEYLALHALYADHADPGDKDICLIGASLAGLIVVVPLLVRGLLIGWTYGRALNSNEGSSGLSRRHQEAEATVTEGPNNPDAPPGLAPDLASDKRAAHE
jgi:hypothetical protein